MLASDNAGKRRELAALLSPLDFALVAQAELGIAAAPETAATFVENALAKARHAAIAAKLPAIADDSGLVVDALDGAPGVHSARYAGEPSDDRANNDELLRALHGRDDRAAHFYCVLVYMRHGLDPAPVIATGRWHGTIATAVRGHGGFGYDPLFVPRGMTVTSAELEPAEKNRMSHRGRAARDLLTQLRDALAP